MDYQPACEVHYAKLAQPSTTPNPVSDRRVDEQQPGAAKDQHRRKLDALHIRTHDQRRSNDGKRHLEHREDNLWNRTPWGIHRYADEEALLQPADNAAKTVAKDQTVACNQPQHTDRGGDGETLHHNGQDRVGPHQTAVEHSQTRQRHEQHQGGRNDDPCSITGIQNRTPLPLPWTRRR